MCGEHRSRGHFGHFMGPFMHSMCGCEPFGSSKETKIKSLEAIKSRLEDSIKHIDEKIVEIQKGESQMA